MSDFGAALSGVASGAAGGAAVGGPVGGAIGGVLGGLSGAFGSRSARKRKKAQEKALNQYRGALNQYGTDMGALSEHLVGGAGTLDDQWRAMLDQQLAAPNPDLAGAIDARTAGMTAAGAPAWQPPAVQGAGAARYLDRLTADRQGRAAADMAPTAFNDALAQMRQGEGQARAGMQLTAADINRGVSDLGQLGGLQQTLLGEPLAQAKAKLDAALGKAETAGARDALASGLLSSLGQLGAMGYTAWNTRPGASAAPAPAGPGATVPANTGGATNITGFPVGGYMDSLRQFFGPMSSPAAPWPTYPAPGEFVQPAPAPTAAPAGQPLDLSSLQGLFPGITPSYRRMSSVSPSAAQFFYGPAQPTYPAP